MTPDDIRDPRWGAGWIDPDGNFWAGGTYDFVHDEIAERLVEHGIVDPAKLREQLVAQYPAIYGPKDLEREDPDTLMVWSGWMKLSYWRFSFFCVDYRRGPTDAQKQALLDWCEAHGKDAVPVQGGTHIPIADVFSVEPGDLCRRLSRI